jgi:DNA (cytosine-5)-methyltransferase 1
MKNNKLKLLDLYCGGGGASYGYEQAGFDVTGIDIHEQKRYRGRFIKSDAIEYLKAHWREYDAVHASPPCQAYSMASMQFRVAGKEYVDLIAPTRKALIETGLPYIIENVPGSPLINPIELCGAMFGLRTYRHRLFESNFEIQVPEHPKHIAKNAKMGRRAKPEEFIQYVGHFPDVKIVQSVTGLTWLSGVELSQSIPPQYTKFIGCQLYNLLKQKKMKLTYLQIKKWLSSEESGLSSEQTSAHPGIAELIEKFQNHIIPENPEGYAHIATIEEESKWLEEYDKKQAELQKIKEDYRMAVLEIERLKKVIESPIESLKKFSENRNQ